MAQVLISPTVGRVVWFPPSANTAEAVFAPPAAGTPLAAIVARVWSDTCVNLTVFDANGVPHPRTSVLLMQDGQPAPDGYYCEWMPFQKGQAKAQAVPVASEGAIERALVAKGKTAPRLSPADLDANIVHTEVVRHVSHSGQVLRWAVLTTKNGFAVTGKPSASVSAENDDADIGESVAIANARAELWPLMGYALKNALAAQ